LSELELVSFALLWEKDMKDMFEGKQRIKTNQREGGYIDKKFFENLFFESSSFYLL
jgi:hypothetical protein